ncbi:hypothetical protein KIL84_010334 [Mauremys mutica]|uniref:CKLF-like MARVEL transmembrane domain-containing protein 7 n=1 Tax=Mauremys mutica TaxID=74926 RepID=A0A9D3XAV7_9SAUR|nr:hypothetical protein KIL84_010334 [Mauremys mutica]
MSHGARVIRTGSSSAGPGSSSCPPPPGPEPGLLDGGYARSCSAMLKVAQMISLLIGFICVKNSPWTNYSASIYFEIVTMCDLIMILVFYFVYLFRAYRMLTCISWPLARVMSTSFILVELTHCTNCNVWFLSYIPLRFEHMVILQDLMYYSVNRYGRTYA